MLAITLHIKTAGTLPTFIEESKKYQITDLTLTGNLNGTDIRNIREMAECDVRGNVTKMNSYFIQSYIRQRTVNNI
jgi:hypothetical protein